MKPDKRPIMTVMELADYLRVHPTTIYRLLKLRQLPAFKVGSEWRFTVESIDRWCLGQLTPPRLAESAAPDRYSARSRAAKCALKVSE